jgi:uncharacterized protein YjbI with pentapeptide repeats
LPIYFSGSQFLGKVVFSAAKFKGGAYFNTKFKEAFFNETNFQGIAILYRAEFKGGAFFSEANFQAQV